MRIIATLLLIIAAMPGAFSQQVIGFQGGEVTAADNWGYTDTGAGPDAMDEAQSAANIKSGNLSLVVGGTDPAGGSCFGGGAGNGQAIDNTFTFESIDLTAYPGVPKTIEFWYGNRQPACNGSGWDEGENLIFRPILNGFLQPPITLETGGNDLVLSIDETSFTYDVPECAETVGFVLFINLNRGDELLFLDDVILTVAGNPDPVTIDAGPGGQVCPGNDFDLSGSFSAVVENITWSGGAGSFGNEEDPGTFYTAGENESGTVVLTLSGTTVCGSTIESQTEIIVSGAQPEASIISDLGGEICPGQTAQLTAFGGDTYLWDNGENSEDIFVDAPGTYTVTVTNECGDDTADITLVPGDVIGVDLTLELCPGGEVEFPDNTTVDTPGDYEVLIEVPADCDTLFSISVVPAVPLSPGPVETVCDYDAETFVISFEVTGGNQATLTAEGVEGSFSNGTFTSEPVPAESDYTIFVSDINNCEVIEISGFEACICPTSAVLTGTTTICAGETTTLNFAFEGIAPFEFSYSDGSEEFDLVSGENNFSLDVSPDSSVVYEAVFVRDTLCTGFAAGTATITVLPVPDAGLDGDTLLCDNSPQVGLTSILGGSPNATGVWTFAANDTVPSVFNPATDIPGFYIYKVDGGICGTDQSSVIIQLSEAPEASISGSYGRCPEGSSDIPVEVTGSGPFEITYSLNGVTQPPAQLISGSPYFFPVNESGNYTLTGIDDGTCAGSAGGSAMVETLLPPRAEFSRTYAGNERGSEVFEFAAFDTTAGNSYSWTFVEIKEGGNQVSVGQSNNPDARLVLRGRYGGLFRACLTVVNADGCETQLCENFEVTIEKYFYMPNAFTPDGDGINDLFFPVTAGFEDYTFDMSVFDRNGSLIFRTDNPDEKWNGSHNGGNHYVKAGVYTWRVEMIPRSSAGSEVWQGHVTVIR